MLTTCPCGYKAISAENAMQHLRRSHQIERYLAKLIVRFDGLCYWCETPILPIQGSNPLRATREHLVPRALGGGGGHNLRLAHAGCNALRGVWSEAEFRALIAAGMVEIPVRPKRSRHIR